MPGGHRKWVQKPLEPPSPSHVPRGQAVSPSISGTVSQGSCSCMREDLSIRHNSSKLLRPRGRVLGMLAGKTTAKAAVVHATACWVLVPLILTWSSFWFGFRSRVGAF